MQLGDVCRNLAPWMVTQPTPSTRGTWTGRMTTDVMRLADIVPGEGQTSGGAGPAWPSVLPALGAWTLDCCPMKRP